MLSNNNPLSRHAMVTLEDLKKERMILGIAVTYWEALEVARRMVDDLYQKTGEVSAEAFARFTGIDVW